MNTFPSYLAIMDYVRMLQMKEMEACVWQEKTKKPKTKGDFSDKSSGPSSKRSRTQAWWGVAQWSSKSTNKFSISSQRGR